MSPEIIITLIGVAIPVVGNIIIEVIRNKRNQEKPNTPKIELPANVRLTSSNPKNKTGNWILTSGIALIFGIISYFIGVTVFGQNTIVDNSHVMPINIGFESATDEKEWQKEDFTEINRTSEISFKGKYSLAITIPGMSNSSEKLVSYNQPINSDFILGKIYFPVQNDVDVKWMIVCIADIGKCSKIPPTEGQWHAFSYDLFTMDYEDEYSGFYLLGQITNNGVKPYVFYIDQIEIYQSTDP